MALLGGKTVPPDGVSVVPHHAAAFGLHDSEVVLRAGVQNANSLPCAPDVVGERLHRRSVPTNS